MTSNVDPRLVERLAETRSRVHAASATISERAAATSRELAERAEERRRANETHSKELDERAAERAEAKDDPNAGNQWMQRAETKDTTFRFGADGDEPATESAPPPSPPARPEPPVRRSQGRHARPDDTFDDDDFSNNNWLR
ncbi:hypothetical protein ACFS2C_00235 [Prauserella oleivorans]|uniref:Translation initiation factor IF-2 n=1 Tax=Prauserella oleivorans TaxID=1478153 RepID=A0ABW5W2T8_9PSEU